MRKPHLYSAAFGIIKNENEEFLLMKRQNTGYFDGGRSLPAGHVEADESPTSAILHEMQEEIGIVPTEYNAIHVLHRMYDHRHYYDIGFLITKRDGSITNNEPELCSELKRFKYDSLPEYMTFEGRRMIEAYFDGSNFSEIDLRPEQS